MPSTAFASLPAPSAAPIPAPAGLDKDNELVVATKPYPLDKVSSTQSADQFGTSEHITLRSVVGRKIFIFAWCGLLLAIFACYLDSITTSTYSVYGLSNFGVLAYEGTLLTLASVATIAMQGPLAALTKQIDLFYIVVVTTIVATLGCVLQAAASNVGVLLFGYILFIMGGMASRFVLWIITSELSSMEWRAFAMAALQLPALGAVFGGGQIAGEVMGNLTWRWGYGIWAILIPSMNTPLLIFLFIARQRLRKMRGPQKSWSWKSINILDIVHKQDLIGIFILVAGICLFLLPIPIKQANAEDLGRASLIAPTVIGFLLLLLFPVWEMKYAKYPLMPLRVLKNRTVLGCFLCIALGYGASSIVTTYTYTYLVVAGNFTVAQATYVSVAYVPTSTAAALFYGWIVSRTHQAKWLITGANLLQVILCAIYYNYVDPDAYKGVVIAISVLFGFAFAGTLTAASMIQAACKKEDVPVAVALNFLAANIGNAIVGGISSGVWAAVLPQELRKILPANLKSQAKDIMQDITVAQSFQWGTPVRKLVNRGYNRTVQILVAIGIVFAVLTLFSMLIARNTRFEEYGELDQSTTDLKTQESDSKHDKAIHEVVA